MSYCHTLAGGIDNVNLVFHPRCINEQMLPYIQGRTCFTAVATFPDVPTTHPFFHYVETIFRLGITGGCAGGVNYCPNNPVTRAQMAIFLLKAKYGSGYTLRALQRHLRRRAVLQHVRSVDRGSLRPRNYDRLRRQQFLPEQHGHPQADGPVPAQDAQRQRIHAAGLHGIFQDVPCANNNFAPWIERIYALGITGGCQTSPLRYCPDNQNTRGQMAVFLVKTFNLTW